MTNEATATKQHTPGPWTVRAGSFCEDGVPSYEVVMNGERTVNAVDARLIAAAPELYQSVRELRETCAAAMRVIAGHGRDELTERFLSEVRRAGVADGVGQRADSLLRRIDGE